MRTNEDNNGVARNTKNIKKTKTKKKEKRLV